MPIKPRKVVEEKKKLTHRDNFLMSIAFLGGGLLRWYGQGEGDMAFALTSLSYVLLAIGSVILISSVLAGGKKKPKS